MSTVIQFAIASIIALLLALQSHRRVISMPMILAYYFAGVAMKLSGIVMKGSLIYDLLDTPLLVFVSMVAYLIFIKIGSLQAKSRCNHHAAEAAVMIFFVNVILISVISMYTHFSLDLSEAMQIWLPQTTKVDIAVSFLCAAWVFSYSNGTLTTHWRRS